MIEKITKFSFYAFLLIFPFGYRWEIFRFISGFHEYETVFFYASDLFLILFLTAGAIILFSKKEKRKKEKSFLFLICFLIAAAFSIIFSPLPVLSICFILRLFILAGTAFLISELIKKEIIKIKDILGIISLGAIFQSALAFLQFKFQKSLGLYFLGEPILSPNISGISKITADGAKIIRAYGTFLHPNILSAFLITGFLALLYFYFKKEKLEEKILILVFSYLILLGIVLTFSRQAWIAFLISIFLLSAIIILKEKIIGVKKIIFILLTLIFAVIPAKDFIFERAPISTKEDAVTERLAYNKMGIDLIKKNSFGSGPGTQVFYAYKNGFYERFGMIKSYLWQPIHNIYLLIASETGILGIALFLLFVFSLFFPIKNIFLLGKNLNLEKTIAKIIFLSFLIIGMSDHFFWTIGQGQIMLWIFIGLLM
ncbi:MAG: O-antigen ligase family protein [Candidatus Pacebacteria bacterium]|nr:O-antigen ligase family protein [Candidatus Paceibacterota bacterium]